MAIKKKRENSKSYVKFAFSNTRLNDTLFKNQVSLVDLIWFDLLSYNTFTAAAAAATVVAALSSGSSNAARRRPPLRRRWSLHDLPEEPLRHRDSHVQNMRHPLARHVPLPPSRNPRWCSPLGVSWLLSGGDRRARSATDY